MNTGELLMGIGLILMGITVYILSGEESQTAKEVNELWRRVGECEKVEKATIATMARLQRQIDEIRKGE